MSEIIRLLKAYWWVLASMAAAVIIALIIVGYFFPDEVKTLLGSALFLGILFVSMIIFFIPTFIAAFRNHHQVAPIILINIFCGMSVVGWVVALIWSVADVKKATT